MSNPTYVFHPADMTEEVIELAERLGVKFTCSEHAPRLTSRQQEPEKLARIELSDLAREFTEAPKPAIPFIGRREKDWWRGGRPR